ncbi:lipoprotein NlpI [Thalassotalea agarivorans]|uniref:Lipoprotein NlpI n=2 Tax=Thalassotalea agarivorans TaxID=349064 RepID=A0A1H9ZWW0_THASX|nr:lipoprotein NlpI [Thalassotalea agarivorans]
MNSAPTIDKLLVAEPMPVNYKSEIALARLTEVIQRAEVTDEQRAQLFYDRGVIFDSIGLRSLARLDFNRALRLKPTLVDAYNFLGIHYTQMQEFNEAYQQFDSTLELAPNHEFAYLNRGIALYYGDRPGLAQEDLVRFYNRQPSDPYRVIWLYFAEHQLDPEKANQKLAERKQQIDDKVWAKQVLRLYLGEINQSQFLASVTKGVRSNQELTERLCEAYFYLGKYSVARGRYNSAANYYKLALSTNVYEFVEHRYAKLELDLMRASFQQGTLPQPN